MNVFNKVTLQSLKKNKTRTIVTIIGIILSAAMICAVTTFVSSVYNYAKEYAIYSNGNYHGAVLNVEFQTYKDVNNTGKLEDSTYGQLLGYAKIDSQNEYKPYMYVIGGDLESDYFDVLPIHVSAGRLPEDTTEIILPEHLATNGGVVYKLGDKITLELGERLLDGYPMTQYNPCYTYDGETGDEVLNEEVIEVRETRTYTVVGFYERPAFEERTAPGYTALTVADKEWTGSTKFDVFFRMEKAKDTYDFIDQLSKDGHSCIYNNDVLLAEGVSRYDSFSTMIISLAVIIIGLIMFGSVSLIYNAFSISVSERTKQFGLLASIGATKKQLKKMVLFEALAVSVVGIPLGVLVGISGIGITLLCIGNKFVSMIGGGFDVPMRICVSWESVVIAILVALITVLISAWIPSKRATKVSAVEAIRQNMDIKAKNKQVKTSKLTYKLFGLPGVLASKHYKRNKKKYRTTVISLFMSIVLFVSASAFTDYLMESVTGGLSVDGYDLFYSIDEDQLGENTLDDVLGIMKQDKNITTVAYATNLNLSGTIDNKYVTQEFLDSFEMNTGEESTEEGKYIYSYVYFVDDSAFDALLAQYKLNRSDYYNKEHPLSLAIDTNISFNGETQRYETLDTLKGNEGIIICTYAKDIEGYGWESEMVDDDGKRYAIYTGNESEDDVLKVPYEDTIVEFTLESGKVLSEIPFFINQSIPTPMNMIYPLSMIDYVVPQEAQHDTASFNYYMISTDHKASEENIKSMLLENGLDAKGISNYAEGVEENRNLVNIIQVFAYGFIVLISLIAAANVFNTISTNISLRRREFAMLKSVGMTAKGFNRMMNFECILYGSKSLILGLPVSAAITYLIYMAVSGGYEIEYYLPWGAIGIAVLSVFLVVFVTMMYSMSKIKKDNPIDALKNENL